jgi:hypothetical protein
MKKVKTLFVSLVLTGAAIATTVVQALADGGGN